MEAPGDGLLLSLAQGGGKMRDPAENEVDASVLVRPLVSLVSFSTNQIQSKSAKICLNHLPFVLSAEL